MKKLLLFVAVPLLFVLSACNNEDHEPKGPSDSNGYEYIDLGLSVKWAMCNVGATKPEAYGEYFSWGEIESKDFYDSMTYKWLKSGIWELTKYCYDPVFGIVDNKNRLEISDDAAHANWGGSWRMPTKAELKELLDKCEWIRTTQNGVDGYKVVSKKNQNSIFLPFAGSIADAGLEDVGDCCLLWSSDIYEHNPDGASILFVGKGRIACDRNARYVGQSIRAVLP